MEVVVSEERRTWLSLLAKADGAELARLWAATGLTPAHQVLRAPEIGAVMARGRQGATGAPFNLGEITVTRCSVRLETGEVGHGYVPGRDKQRALTVAVIDAALQTGAAGRIRRDVLEPLMETAGASRAAQARKAGATRVDFFTMVRGED